MICRNTRPSFFGELGERYAVLEYANDKGEMLETHKQRKNWNSTEKAPNIDYFKALAYEKYELDRQKEFTGVLKSYSKEEIVLQIEDSDVSFDRANVALIRLSFDF